MGICFNYKVTTATEVRPQLLLDLVCDLPVNDSQMEDELACLDRWAREGKISIGDAYISRRLGLLLYNLYRWAKVDIIPQVLFILKRPNREEGKGPFSRIYICATGVEAILRESIKEQTVFYFDPRKPFAQTYQDRYVPDEATMMIVTAVVAVRDQYLRMHPETRIIADSKAADKIIDQRLWVIAREIIKSRKEFAIKENRPVDYDIDDALVGLATSSLCQNRVSVRDLVQMITMDPKSIGIEA